VTPENLGDLYQKVMRGEIRPGKPSGWELRDEPAKLEEEFLSSGHFACPGCGETLAFRHVLKALGRKVAVITTAGCGSVVDGYWPFLPPRFLSSTAPLVRRRQPLQA